MIHHPKFHWDLIKHHVWGDDGALDDFLEVFEAAVLDFIPEDRSDPRIGLYLTGGYDSRSILAVLLHHEYQPTTVTYPRGRDQELAGAVSRAFELPHIQHNVGSRDEPYRLGQWIATHREHAPDFDVMYSGLFMDEVWGNFDIGRGNKYDRAIKKGRIPDFYRILREHPNLACPAVTRPVMQSLYDVNDYYLMEKNLQREIIDRYYPDLWSVEVIEYPPKWPRIKRYWRLLLNGKGRYA